MNPATAERPTTASRYILDSTFQATPYYELIPFENLRPEQQAALADLPKDPEFYGLLHPYNNAALPVKSVCRNAARLFLALQQPSKLPSFVNELVSANQAVAQLVVDGILAVEHDGRFVCGAEAFGFLYGDFSSVAPKSPVAELSLEALQYAGALPIKDAMALSERLYAYNRIPCSPAWTRKFPTEESVAQYLGLHPQEPNFRRLRAHWNTVRASSGHGWISFQPRGTGDEGRKLIRDQSIYKLYVSPRPESLRPAFDAVVRVLINVGPEPFKVGKDVFGILRPDKMVIYFGSWSPLEQTAQQLAKELDGCSAHSVPFTAQLGASPILSWGMDPKVDYAAPPWLQHESWRLWVTNRLAIALLNARSSCADIQPWRFALERIRVEGVDTNTWAPNVPPTDNAREVTQ